MRELPEPAAVFVEYGGDIFTRDQVLYIQRQAYEDGLRDAAELCKKNQHQWSGSASDYDRGNLKASQVLEAVITARLTASQKEAE